MSAKRGRGRPPLTAEAREAARQLKVQRERDRRKAIKIQRARVKEMVARETVPAKDPEAVLAEMGRRSGAGKRFEPTAEQRAQVTTLAGLGLPQDQIALLVLNPITGAPISEQVLRSAFERELAAGPAQANSSVAQSLFKMATGTGNVKRVPAAAMFWLKARAGWRETQHVEVDLRAGVLVAPAGVSPEKWIESARAVDVEKLEPGASERASA